MEYDLYSKRSIKFPSLSSYIYRLNKERAGAGSVELRVFFIIQVSESTLENSEG